MDRPSRAHHVITTQIQKAFVGFFSLPQMKRHGPAGNKVLNSSRKFQLGCLHEVRRIEPGSQSVIEMKVEETPQFQTVAAKKLFARQSVSPTNLIQQLGRVFGIWSDIVHTNSPLPIHRLAKFVTDSSRLTSVDVQCGAFAPSAGRRNARHENGVASKAGKASHEPAWPPPAPATRRIPAKQLLRRGPIAGFDPRQNVGDIGDGLRLGNHELWV